MILVITSTVIQGNWRINLRRFAPSEPAQDVSKTTTGYDTVQVMAWVTRQFTVQGFSRVCRYDRYHGVDLTQKYEATVTLTFVYMSLE